METGVPVLTAKTPWELLAAARAPTWPPGWSAGGGAWDAQWHQSLPAAFWNVLLDEGLCLSVPCSGKLCWCLEPSPEDPRHTLKPVAHSCGPRSGPRAWACPGRGLSERTPAMMVFPQTGPWGSQSWTVASTCAHTHVPTAERPADLTGVWMPRDTQRPSPGPQGLTRARGESLWLSSVRKGSWAGSETREPRLTLRQRAPWTPVAMAAAPCPRCCDAWGLGAWRQNRAGPRGRGQRPHTCCSGLASVGPHVQAPRLASPSGSTGLGHVGLGGPWASHRPSGATPLLTPGQALDTDPPPHQILGPAGFPGAA